MGLPAMSHVFHRHSRKTYPLAVAGHGCWIADASGRRYLDACGGAAVSVLGHQHPAVIAAMHEQIDRLSYAHTSFFTTPVAEELADRLVSAAPFFGDNPERRLDRAYIVSSGSESIEAALKLARQFSIERGDSHRTHFIARRQSYHGNTLGALAVGGNAWRRAQFKELLMPVSHVAPCYEYRGRQGAESPQDYSARLVREFEQEVLAIGPERVLAFVAEPVVGATLGAVPPTPGYFKGIREVCDRFGILLILDEVMCGMGRTGSLFAYEQEGVAPDMVAIAKGLGGGYQPIAALLVSKQIHDTIADGSGFFQHGHTYLGHPVACAAAVAVLRVLTGTDLIGSVRGKSAQLMAGLQSIFASHPNVGDIRGRGLFVGIELVSNRNSKTPFPAALRMHERVKAEAMLEGLMCYPMGGTIDGQEGDHVMLAPPLVMEGGEINQVIERLANALQKSLMTSG